MRFNVVVSNTLGIGLLVLRGKWVTICDLNYPYMVLKHDSTRRYTPNFISLSTGKMWVTLCCRGAPFYMPICIDWYFMCGKWHQKVVESVETFISNRTLLDGGPCKLIYSSISVSYGCRLANFCNMT